MTVLAERMKRASRVRQLRTQLQREFYSRWEEGKHPRDEGGKFSDKEGGGSRARKATRKTLKDFSALAMTQQEYVDKNHPHPDVVALMKEHGWDGMKEKHPDIDLIDKWAEPERVLRGEWSSQARAAVSVGATTPDEMTSKALKGEQWRWLDLGMAEGVEDLPDTLYHATTAATPVQKTGLKSREELGQSSGAGLGGGADDTVSFTTDRALADQIAKSMKMARKVARGEITVDDLLHQAREGVGTNGKSWAEIEGDSLEKRAKAIYRTDTKFGPKPEAKGSSWDKRFGPWEPDLDKEPNFHGNRVHWLRHPTEETVLERTMEFFKRWLAYRESKGGPSDPLFFGSDIAGLANLKEDEIKVVEAKPVDGAKGYQLSAMGEWRTWSGDAVDIVDIYRRQLQSEFYARGWKEDEHPRDEGGKFTTGSAGPKKGKAAELSVGDRDKMVEQALAYARRYATHQFGTPDVADTPKGAEGLLNTPLGTRQAGECYSSAGKFIMNASFGGTLSVPPKMIHGTVSMGDVRIGHAWVEIGDVVFDGTHTQFFDRDSYRAFTEAETEHEYTWEECAKLMVGSEHWGPWEETDGVLGP